MECYTNEHGFLEELLGLNHEIEYYQNHQDFNTTNWSYDCFANNNFSNPTSFDEDYNTLPIDQTLNSSFINQLSPPQIHSQTVPYQLEDLYPMSILDDEDGGTLFGNGFQNMDIGAPCKVENGSEMPSFHMGFYPEESERKKKAMKKINGQPSKNLMAERRRRKRLNDRLSMLRSVVPKISKMDRTSILGDTIDYMKELIERINNLQEEMNVGLNQLDDVLKPKEISVRNSHKFDVERRNRETKIEIGCGGKPGMLLSTVTTLEEAFGLQIQHCVISCFADFTMQASCISKDLKHREILDSEEIKQALIRNAGYGGRCL